MMNISGLRASSVSRLVLVLTALCGGAVASAQEFDELQIAGMQADVRHEATVQTIKNMGYSTEKGDFLESSPDPNFYTKRMYLSAADHSTFVEIDVWNKTPEHEFKMSMFAHSPENMNYMVAAVDAAEDAASVPTLKKWESKAAQILGRAAATSVTADR